MKREYLIVIEAPAAHQPSNNEIFKAVVKLVDNRVMEFPKNKKGRHVTIIPQRRGTMGPRRVARKKG